MGPLIEFEFPQDFVLCACVPFLQHSVLSLILFCVCAFGECPCVPFLPSTLLGTVLSLQPQRSVAQGESKEEKVSLPYAYIILWKTYSDVHVCMNCVLLNTQYFNIHLRCWIWHPMSWNRFQIWLTMNLLTSSSVTTWTLSMLSCYKRYHNSS